MILVKMSELNEGYKIEHEDKIIPKWENTKEMFGEIEEERKIIF